MRTAQWVLAIGALIVAACGSTDDTADDQATGRASNEPSDHVTTTVIVTAVDPLFDLLSLLEDLEDQGLAIVWTDVVVGTAVDSEDTVDLRVTEVVYNPSLDEIPDVVQIDSYFGPALSTGDRVLALHANNKVWTIAVEEDGGVFVQDDSILHRLGTAGADFIKHVNTAPASPCDGGTAREVEEPTSLDQAIVNWIAGATPRAEWELAQRAFEDLVDEADRLAVQSESEPGRPGDPVAGTGVPVDQYAVLRQLAAGSSPDSVDPSPTVPIYLDTSELDSRTAIVIFDEASGHLTGLLQSLAPGDDSGYSEEGIKETFIGIPQGDTVLYALDEVWLAGCQSLAAYVEIAQEHGELITRIAPGTLAGSTRARVNVGTGGVVALDAAAIEALRSGD